ncbi:hypothetical protein GCM10022243_39570 [Saccharothrix violaceirubra]|uniref:Uncharacterized protein n=1 Tax=Saccharothrix violaceirubra TaxID=413306 RepID=A0A7W7T0E3_9PSEU|nr:hypothetical protein [Saccharothrix violaceirubra]MBB4964259.1 hypothetical protein [Saccharothrix violaceirubra]
MTADWLARRAEIVAEGNDLLYRAEEMDLASDLSDDVWLVRRLPDPDDAVRWALLRDEYRDLLPDVTVARCPDTGAVVRWAIDTGGLDGWFWDSNYPVRRAPELPPTWLAMTGAVALRGEVAWVPFRCRPGPRVPYVVPRLLREDGVRAVIAQVPIGTHVGWAVSYFGPLPSTVDGIGIWGRMTMSPPLGGGGHEYFFFDVEDNDYDLGPWLESGKLLWIAPDDDTATLREGVAGCPYRGLEGSHLATLIDGYDVWDDSEDDPYVESRDVVHVEFDPGALTPEVLARLCEALDLEPLVDRPREENAVRGVTTGFELPPDTRLRLFRGTGEWRLEADCKGEFPAHEVVDAVRERLLGVLTAFGFGVVRSRVYGPDRMPR